MRRPIQVKTERSAQTVDATLAWVLLAGVWNAKLFLGVDSVSERIERHQFRPD
jgi:hypothetical protein